MLYRYVVRTNEQRVQEGTLQVNDEDQAWKTLRDAGYRVVSLKLITEGKSVKRFIDFSPTVKRKDVVTFSKQLATLLDSGMGLLPGLQFLLRHCKSKPFKEILSAVSEDVAAGNPLSEALGKYPNTFPALYIRMLEVGERTGDVTPALRQVVSYMERQKEMMKNAVRPLIYPAIVMLLAAGVMVLFLTSILPKMEVLFTALNTDLPITTRAMMAMSDFIIANRLWLFLAALALPIIALRYFRSSRGRFTLARMSLRAPLIGDMILKSETVQFSRTLALLLKAGVPMAEAISVTEQSLSNLVIRDAVKDIRQGLFDGKEFSELLRATHQFPELLVEMVSVGEETDTLDSTLANLADAYEVEVKEHTDALTGLIEPAMTVFIAAAVGLLALSIIGPMYSIVGAAGQ
jgi:type IV pilus assembly protein PilC